ncbi:hypothetical protein HYH02_001548 [Chlamydomonas schloesseri]|uniref:Uncharacterized protein n=1 Tax=Chlamydomonas schloesseri TaxID=2026947 RepID=A0A836BBZ6_9CHLO|nr:hypothetical protein HYH02_001548 [Chlamydomonas schloesseri]|eukprot:KAG2453324.1 hypothetical protein HYH02_001548 [Chlamydomonas schloesseri]
MASVLRIEIDELQNAIQHLERSNRELKELLTSDPDPEYRQAIGENIVTVAKKRARVAALEEELRRITGEAPAEGAAEAVEPESVPVEEQATTEPAAAAAAAAGSRVAQAQQGPGQQEEAMEVDAADSSAAAAAPAGAIGAASLGTGQGSVGRAAGEGDGVWL